MVSPSSERRSSDPVAGLLARVLTASQVVAVVAVVVGLVLSPSGRAVASHSVAHLVTLLGVGALLVGPFLGLAAVAIVNAQARARWYALGAALVAGAGMVLATLS